MSCAGTELTRTSEVVTGAACLTEVQLLKVLCAYVSLLLSHSLHNTTRSRSVCCLARFPSRAFFRGHRFQFLENLSKVFEFPCGVSYTGFQIVKKSRLCAVYLGAVQIKVYSLHTSKRVASGVLQYSDWKRNDWQRSGHFEASSHQGPTGGSFDFVHSFLPVWKRPFWLVQLLLREEIRLASLVVGI